MAAPKKSVAKDKAQEKGGGKGNGSQSPLEFTREQELTALRDMLLIRRFEEKAGQLYGMGAIGGFCHLYIGQEAIVVGMQMALKKGDQVITTYRDHGHMLATGMDPKGVMAELTGRRGGYSRGKGGSMHMFSKEKNFYGGHGIVGANVPLGAGIAFANRYRGNGRVLLTYRYRGHSMSDPGKYRSREEIQKMREEHDPIEQVRRRVLEGRVVSEDELKTIDGEVRGIINGATEFAQGDAEPAESELWTDV